MFDNTNVTIAAVGDIMLGDQPICIRHGVGSKIKEKGPKYIFKYVSKLINRYDIKIGNLEVILSNKNINRKSLKSIQLRGVPNSIKGLIYAGFNILTLENNHIRDHGYVNFLKTQMLLKKNNIDVIVTRRRFKSNKNIFTFKKIKFGILAYNMVNFKRYTIRKNLETSILKEIIYIKSHCDILLISLHWGHEFMKYPSSAQVNFAHKIIDNGADIIIGHHPHVLQGIEKYKGKVIAYSLGNFVFDMWQKETKKTIVLAISISKTGINNVEIIPVVINKNYQPMLIKGKRKLDMLNEVNTLSTLISEKNDMDQYLFKVKEKIEQNRIEIKKYFLKNIFRYSIRTLMLFAKQYLKKISNKI